MTLRFIPTCVGNIRLVLFCLITLRLHPHVCGEHSKEPLCILGTSGSSPRVWGTFNSPITTLFIPRFIPTCVGNIVDSSRAAARIAVHPHVCGEHITERSASASQDGSSPRVWGTYPRKMSLECGLRFIPTCVGNIFHSLGLFREDAVHPHVCGEHKNPRINIPKIGGSSPRVWGT